MSIEYIKNILSKKIVISLIYIIGFILLIINFKTNFFNGGSSELVGGTVFDQFQYDSEYLVIGKIFNDKYNINKSKYGLYLGSFGLEHIYDNNITINKEDLSNASYTAYPSQVGLQGHTLSFLYNKLNLSVDTIKIILISLLAIVLLYICKYISIKFNKKLAFIYFIVFLLSPWICAFARNLYWVEFTWFLPILFGLILSTNYKKKKVFLPLISLTIFIKCLCGYEYITVIMLGSIIFIIYDFIFEKDKNKKKEIFKTIILTGIFALIGFICAFLIHSYLRGDGDLIAGVERIYKTDIVRRAVTFSDPSSFDGILLESINASPKVTLIKYFFFNTNVITGISGFMFRFLVIASILVLIFNLIIRKKESMRELVIYIMLFLTCISWFVLASPHSYIHGHMNYVLWYFGYIQIMIYILIDFIINILKTISCNKKEVKIYNDVPNFETKEFNNKKNKYCLCIPIINESERIEKELKKAKENKIDKLVDIIICDGGSTDGSTSESKLKKLGVNTLLTKKDIGKQGAQLRMGFYYALERGYEGIITIDGNNKDSIEDVPKFIEKLEEGYDFVQGSRFVKGGQAINTPFIRNISVRLLHAPIISLTAGEKFSDTTNAYRAYSKKYLTHNDVQPFRKIFQSYELLAYLSVRASQLGLKTCEIPVRREYPKKGKTPTKISMIKGNYELLKILFKNAFGVYDPIGGKENEIR